MRVRVSRKIFAAAAVAAVEKIFRTGPLRLDDVSQEKIEYEGHDERSAC